MTSLSHDDKDLLSRFAFVDACCRQELEDASRGLRRTGLQEEDSIKKLNALRSAATQCAGNIISMAGATLAISEAILSESQCLALPEKHIAKRNNGLPNIKRATQVVRNEYRICCDRSLEIYKNSLAALTDESPESLKALYLSCIEAHDRYRNLAAHTSDIIQYKTMAASTREGTTETEAASLFTV